ncbi:hypothetical protein E9529_12600 [Blastococcus sp. KM273128]|uniref:hypothetical protein n=1 Tax=Blastococcus sp. KM273128 TaxID=2570314 RepID=UPI001F1E4A98|nr:hypothetical protein [Blastococcus sp. KM273128]MCF6745105.1 hypothetical protein [Blastococcus sp. KM273128]
MRDPHLAAPVLTAEEAAIGCALWLPVDQAATIVALLPESDIASPNVRLVRRCIVELSDAGVTPDPAAVLAHATSRQHVVGARRIGNLTRTLWRLYDHRATVPASWRYYVAQTLEQAWRRRTTEMAVRLAQVADHASAEELARLTRAEQAAVDAVRARRHAITQERPVLVA